MGNCHYPCSFYFGNNNIHFKNNNRINNKSISTSKLINVIPNEVIINNNNNTIITKTNQNIFNSSKSNVTVVPEILNNNNNNNNEEEETTKQIIIIEGHQIDKTGLQFKEVLHDNNNLMLAIKRNDIITVKRLLDEGQEIDNIGTFGSTPLITSCQYSHNDITQLILNQNNMNKKIINHCNEKNVSAILYASMNGDITIVEKLISLGAETFLEPSMPIHNPITDVSSSLTPLSAAIINGHTTIVKFLLDKNNNVNQVFDFPISKSIIIDKKNIIKSPNNVTPILLASRYGKLDIIKELLLRKADWKLKDNENSTVLHHICKLDDDIGISIIDTFKSYGYNFDDLMTNFDINGDTSLHIACDHKNIKIILYLIQNNINVNIQNIITGITPLHIAIRRRNNEIVKLLLQNKADPNVVDIQNISCIDMVSKLRKDSDIYKLIINFPKPAEQNIVLENIENIDSEFM